MALEEEFEMEIPEVEAEKIVSDKSSTQWTINNKLMEITRLIDKINRDINVDDAMGVVSDPFMIN